jgi:hypothetical protein
MLLAFNQASDLGPNACQNQPGCLAMTSQNSLGITRLHKVSIGETQQNPFTLTVECAPTHMIRSFSLRNEETISPLNPLDGWKSVFIEQESNIDQITASVEWLPDGSFHLWRLTLRDKTEDIAHLGLPQGFDPPDRTSLDMVSIPVKGFGGFKVRTLDTDENGSDLAFLEISVIEKGSQAAVEHSSYDLNSSWLNSPIQDITITDILEVFYSQNLVFDPKLHLDQLKEAYFTNCSEFTF